MMFTFAAGKYCRRRLLPPRKSWIAFRVICC